MKYVFTDFDGVVTSTEETPGSYLTHMPSEYGMTPSRVRLLVGLARRAGAKIVLSSNWRRFEPDGACRFSFAPGAAYVNPTPAFIREIGGLYAGTLPKDKGLRKPQALELWIEENGAPDAFVVFDDDPGEGFAESPYAANFVLTDYRTGVTPYDIEKAERMLGLK